MQTIAKAVIGIVSFFLELGVTILLWFLLLAICIMILHIIRDYLYKKADAEENC